MSREKRINPYPYSDTNKRYRTFDHYLRGRFGRKCAKIPLNVGFTCPNIDGTKGTGGCIYCLGGSAAVTTVGDTVREQYEFGTNALRRKWGDFASIPYLQANSCTYGDPDRLRELYAECAALPDSVMLAVATRADCLSDEVLELLCETSRRIPLIVELGLQTSNDATAEKINRCHTTAEFAEGYRRLRAAGGDIAVCIHVIDGLPGEDRRDMLETARFTARLRPDMVKIHLLHVLRGTRLYETYEAGEYVPMERGEYIETVADQLELLPAETVIARLTGDGGSAELVAPEWSRRKIGILNDIDKELLRRNTMQGIYAKE